MRIELTDKEQYAQKRQGNEEARNSTILMIVRKIAGRFVQKAFFFFKSRGSPQMQKKNQAQERQILKRRGISSGEKNWTKLLVRKIGNHVNH